MKQRLQFNFLTAVLGFLVTFSLSSNTNATGEAANGARAGKPQVEAPAATARPVAPTKTVISSGESPTAAAINQTASRAKEERDRCETAKKDMIQAQGGFLSACREDSKKQIESPLNFSDDDKFKKAMEQRDKGVKACSEEFDECLKFGKDEVNFSQFTQGMSGADAMPNWPSGMDASEKRCSRLSQDKYDSALQKAEDALNSRKEKLADRMEKNSKSEADLQKSYDDLQKEFLEDQEAKTKAALAKKGSKREFQATFDKQRGEYDAQIRKAQTEIFQMQQQALLLSKQRGKEVNMYKIALLKCKEEVRKMRSPEYTQKMGSNLSNGVGGAAQSDARIVWAACASNALQDRENEATKYKVAMEQVNMNIQSRSADLAALQESSRKQAQMFAEALQDEAENDQKEEQAFLQKQQNKWLQIKQVAEKQQAKTFENQQLLTDARQQVTTASNKLNNYMSEEPLGDKSYEEMRTNFNKYKSLQETVAEVCNKTKLQEFQTRADQLQDRGAASTDGQ